MLQQDALRGEVSVKWYEDGRMSLNLPNDPSVAYFMLHAAMDEVQERMWKRKVERQTEERRVVVPKDGNHQGTEWGK